MKPFGRGLGRGLVFLTCLLTANACNSESPDDADAATSPRDSSLSEARVDGPSKIADSASEDRAIGVDHVADGRGPHDSSLDAPTDAFSVFGDWDRRSIDERPPTPDGALPPWDAGAGNADGSEAGALADVAAPDGSAPDGSAPDAPLVEAGPPVTTESIFARRSPACLQCAVDNGCFDVPQQGSTCEEPYGISPVDGGPTPVPVVEATGETEIQICLRLTQKIFDTGCGALGALSPCLCGTTDQAACVAGTAAPAGPLYDDYIDGFGTADVSKILMRIADQTFGTGRANALINCAEAFNCPCFEMDGVTDGGAE